MLVLARKPGEAIQIGDGITVHVVEMRGKQVRLGIEARAEQLVHRSELHGRLSAEDLHMVDLPRHQSKAVPAEKEQDRLEKERINEGKTAELTTMAAGRSAPRDKGGHELPHGTAYRGTTFANTGTAVLTPLCPTVTA